jgi:hypothetical protein
MFHWERSVSVSAGASGSEPSLGLKIMPAFKQLTRQRRFDAAFPT